MSLIVQLPAISAEQQIIVDSVIGDFNVIVDSVAGSGKTTTILYIALNANKNILLFTYNSKLRKETQSRAESLGLDNIEVHTYHSFGVRYISSDCKTDEGLIKFVNGGDAIIPVYDMIIIDECQDMTPLYYNLVLRVLIAGRCGQLCVIGDKYQSIYSYAGADSRFIILANQIYPATTPWERHSLNVSYRVTRQIASFINKCILGCDRLSAVKDGPKPNYTVYNVFNPYIVVNEVKSLLRKYSPNDIFILAASVKSINYKNPAKIIARRLSDSGIKVYMPTNDESRLDSDVMQGKIAFISFHQAKGLERKAVIVLGFDQSYFTFHNKNDPDNVCSSALYVAITRASEYLSVYHGSTKDILKFINVGTLSTYANVTGVTNEIERALLPNKLPNIAVTKLTQHMDSNTIAYCMSLLECRHIRAADTIIDTPMKSQQHIGNDIYYEEVSDINGVAIVANYEYKKFGSMTICPDIKDLGPISTPLLLEISNRYLGELNDINFKVNQITNYDWFDPESLKLSYDRLSRELHPIVSIQFEHKIGLKLANVNILGSIDVLTNDRIIEIKFVNELSPEHFIQLAIYGFMYSTTHPMKCHLFNVRTDELIEITFNFASIYRIISILLCKKFHRKSQLTDKEFLGSLNVSNGIIDMCNECIRNQ